MSARCIEVLAFEGCPNVGTAVDRAHAAAAAAGPSASVRVVLIETVEDAHRLQFLGSPTVRVDGVDVDPSARERRDFGLQCRVYAVDGRLQGAPPVDWIAAAVLGETSQDAALASVPGGCCPRVEVRRGER